VKNTKLAELDFLTDKMDVQLYMFGAAVVDWVRRHVHRRDVVTVHHRSFGNDDMELAQQLSKPAAFSDDVGDGAILGLRTGP
jgi:hypothetical protein